MKGFLFWQRWLFAVSLLIVLFGTALALFNQTPLLDALVNAPVRAAFWGGGSVDDSALRFQRWMFGVLGATLCGWGFFTAFIAYYAFPKKEIWAWNCIGLGMAVWYFIDTALSWLYGAYFNVIINSALLILFALPLLFTWHYFEKPSA
jgi:hypothetical protein